MNLPENLILKQMEMGPMGNYVYFIGDQQTKEVAVVDLSGDVDALCQMAGKEGYKISALLLTHSHFDHTTGVEELLDRCNIPVYLSKEEARFFSPTYKYFKETIHGERIQIGGIEIECLLTPGHSPGSQCYKYQNVLLTGDTLFIDGCGRCDLPGGNPKEMYNSLYNILMKLPDDTIIFPGHAYGTVPYDTIGNQKQTNHFLICESEKEFLTERM